MHACMHACCEKERQKEKEKKVKSQYRSSLHHPRLHSTCPRPIPGARCFPSEASDDRIYLLFNLTLAVSRVQYTKISSVCDRRKVVIAVHLRTKPASCSATPSLQRHSTLESDPTSPSSLSLFHLACPSIHVYSMRYLCTRGLGEASASHRANGIG